MKVYLAGPDVFRPDVLAWTEAARETCRRYGFEALLPIDHSETAPEKIFLANIDLIRKAQVIVANLNPFRGAEPDSGTCFEVGYALALGKKVCGYVGSMEAMAPRVGRLEGSQTKSGHGVTDSQGYLIEDFGLPCNLMLAMAGQIVEGGLEECLQSIRQRPISPP